MSFAVLAGAAEAVHRALTSPPDFAAWGLDVRGAAIIGAGDASIPVLVRAPAWEALTPSGGDVLLLAAAPPSVAATRAVLTKAASARMRVLLIDGQQIRKLNLDDLVGAPLGDVDWARIRARIAGKRVFITGGGGSIGGELARRVSALAPKRLTLLDSSEFNLFQIGLELRNAELALADVRDAPAMQRWFAREKPEIVFHAAALKQVPLVEMFPSEGVLTNVCGTRNVVEAAHAVGADVIFVSTDKAVDPSGMMGASKRLSELYCQAVDRRGPHRAIPVRLGNVLGSTGSVSPIFFSQFAAGGPLTVTDPSVTRYFLSIPQAADVLLQAAAIGLGAESPRGAALVIDMGEALPVVELARDVIRLNGLRPDIDMPITFVGLRPGEKLHEQLVGGSEQRAPIAAQGVIAAMSEPRGWAEINNAIDRIGQLARAGEDEKVAAETFATLEIPMPLREIAAKA